MLKMKRENKNNPYKQAKKKVKNVVDIMLC